MSSGSLMVGHKIAPKHLGLICIDNAYKITDFSPVSRDYFCHLNENPLHFHRIVPIKADSVQELYYLHPVVSV